MKEYLLWLAKLLTFIIVIFVLVPTLLAVSIAGMQSVLESGNDEGVGDASKLVSVVELSGEIDDVKDTVSDLYRAAADDKVKGIVLRIDSPGGAVGPSQDLNTAVKVIKERKPVVVSMGAMAASGGLYAAVSASKIFAEPGTLTGSIGVIMQIPNLTKITQVVGLQMVTVKSGELKDVGNPFRDMTDRERQFLQDTINAAYEQFVQAVSEGRSLSVDEVKRFADGRIILGSQAKELKLIDELGDLHQAARAVFELRKEPLAEGQWPRLQYQEDNFENLRKYIHTLTALPKMFSAPFRLRYSVQ